MNSGIFAKLIQRPVDLVETILKMRLPGLKPGSTRRAPVCPGLDLFLLMATIALRPWRRAKSAFLKVRPLFGMRLPVGRPGGRSISSRNGFFAPTGAEPMAPMSMARMNSPLL